MEAAERGPFDTQWITVGEAARRCGVDPRTIRRWADSGQLEARETPAGHRRINAAALNETLRPANKRLRLVRSANPAQAVTSWVEQAGEWEFWDVPPSMSDDQVARLRRDATELAGALNELIGQLTSELGRRDDAATRYTAP